MADGHRELDETEGSTVEASDRRKIGALASLSKEVGKVEGRNDREPDFQWWKVSRPYTSGILAGDGNVKLSA